jgi:hypothetical protein
MSFNQDARLLVSCPLKKAVLASLALASSPAAKALAGESNRIARDRHRLRLRISKEGRRLLRAIIPPAREGEAPSRAEGELREKAGRRSPSPLRKTGKGEDLAHLFKKLRPLIKLRPHTLADLIVYARGVRFRLNAYGSDFIPKNLSRIAL